MHQQRNLRVVQHQGGLLRAGPALGSRAKLTHHGLAGQSYAMLVPVKASAGIRAKSRYDVSTSQQPPPRVKAWNY
ncbi:hypothetical protein TEQG_08714 [Trichophyton equinum CBS 127.97]|nr:hypothetical protein TEQG_08714 [Trichophyton equinum CBS 127.97]